MRVTHQSHSRQSLVQLCVQLKETTERSENQIDFELSEWTAFDVQNAKSEPLITLRSLHAYKYTIQFRSIDSKFHFGLCCFIFLWWSSVSHSMKNSEKKERNDEFNAITFQRWPAHESNEDDHVVSIKPTQSSFLYLSQSIMHEIIFYSIDKCRYNHINDAIQSTKRMIFFGCENCMSKSTVMFSCIAKMKQKKNANVRIDDSHYWLNRSEIDVKKPGPDQWKNSNKGTQ